ncbi:MAG: hypothetical protein WBG43_02815 [Marinifilaceae bacterium]
MKFLYLLISICLTCPIFGQNINTGTSYSGMGNSCVMLSSPESIYHNVAGIHNVKNYVVGMSYIEKFNIKEFSTRSLFVVCPFKWFVSAVDYQIFGYSKYCFDQFGLSIARSLSSNFSIGVKLRYLHSFIENYHSHRTDYNIDLGIQYKYKDYFYIGANISNLVDNNNPISEQLFRLGLAYRYTDFLFSFEYDKILDFKEFYLMGFEYKILNNFSIKSGYNTIGNTKYFGLEYKYKKFSSSVAFSMHEILGISSELSFSYEI